jgi:hypothetical protein
MFSPRVGFNWNAAGERRTQVRGGTGIFTGRVPFVWIGNVISNPGANPNLYPAKDPIFTGDSSSLAQSFDLNAMTSDFKWPQIWTTDLAVDQQLPWGLLGTVEVIYGKDLPAMARKMAYYYAKARRHLTDIKDEFQRQIPADALDLGKAMDSDFPTAEDEISVPLGLVANTENGYVDLYWDPIGDGGPYGVKRKSQAGATAVLIASSLADTCFKDYEVAPGATYVYTVHAIRDGRAGGDSDEVTATLEAH